MRGQLGILPVGRVVAAFGRVSPYCVLDQRGEPVEPTTSYLRERVLGDVSSSTCRSYAYDLLRWFRLLWALDVPWNRATEAETAVLVGQLRWADNPQRRRTRREAPTTGSVNARTGKPEPAAGYAPATIAHALTVVHGFYDFHLHFGRGPLVNPVPESAARRRAMAHRSPLEPHRPHRRARLRPKLPAREPRSLPDALFDELLARMRNDRDRALLAFYVTSGARASELLGVRVEDVDWAPQRLLVVSKGTRLRQPVPASPDAFAYLGRYLDAAGLGVLVTVLPPAAMEVGPTARRRVSGLTAPTTTWSRRLVRGVWRSWRGWPACRRAGRTGARPSGSARSSDVPAARSSESRPSCVYGPSSVHARPSPGTGGRLARDTPLGMRAAGIRRAAGPTVRSRQARRLGIDRFRTSHHRMRHAGGRACPKRVSDRGSRSIRCKTNARTRLGGQLCGSSGLTGPSTRWRALRFWARWIAR